MKGNTSALIPMFAIGVFRLHAGPGGHGRALLRARGPGWCRRATINATGASVTAVATAVFLLTKFAAGGWVVVVVTVPLLMVGFWRVRTYYQRAG
ncbi:MAG: amino acid permease, partial [Streptosporangiaceae bacterium]